MYHLVFTVALFALTDAHALVQAPSVVRGAIRGIPTFRVETQRSFHSSQQRKRGGALALLQTSTSTYNESASFGARDSQWYLKQITKAWSSNYQGLVKETALDELDSIWGSRVLMKREVFYFISLSPHPIAFSLSFLLARSLSIFPHFSLSLRIRRLDTHSMFAEL